MIFCSKGTKRTDLVCSLRKRRKRRCWSGYKRCEHLAIWCGAIRTFKHSHTTRHRSKFYSKDFGVRLYWDL